MPLMYNLHKQNMCRVGVGGDHPIGSNGPARQKELCCLLPLAYYESSYYLMSVKSKIVNTSGHFLMTEVSILGHMHSPNCIMVRILIAIAADLHY